MTTLSTQQRRALAILRPYDGPIGYWTWRSQMRPFRKATHKQLEDLGLIRIRDGLVEITDEGRAILERIQPMEQPHCYRCGEPLPGTFDMSSPDGWCEENVAPGAASGGTMKPVHWRCSMMLKIGAGKGETWKRERTDKNEASTEYRVRGDIRHR